MVEIPETFRWENSQHLMGRGGVRKDTRSIVSLAGWMVTSLETGDVIQELEQVCQGKEECSSGPGEVWILPARLENSGLEVMIEAPETGPVRETSQEIQEGRSRQH